MRASAPNPFVRRFTQPGVILTVIAIVGSMGLVGGFLQIRSRINSPFTLGAAAGSGDAVAAEGGDIDGDGLADSLEAQIGTSPYLADTDSDGVSDGQEVASGLDPTCIGASCSSVPQSSATQAAEGGDEPTAAGGSSVEPVTPEQLRALLVESGLDAQQVGSLTDDELVAAWQVALQQASGVQ